MRVARDELVAHAIHVGARHRARHLHRRRVAAAPTAPITSQLPVVERHVVAFPRQLRRALAARSGRAAGRSSRRSAACTKSTMRRHAATCSGAYMPGAAERDARLGRHAGHLGDDEPRAAERARAEMHEVEVVRRAVVGAVHVHRRHDDAVGERHAAQRERREHRRRSGGLVGRPRLGRRPRPRTSARRRRDRPGRAAAGSRGSRAGCA